MQQGTSVCLWLNFLPDRLCLQANIGSTCQLTSIFGHFWPMRVPVRLNFAKVCFNFSVVVCTWLVSQGIFPCRNDLSCFSFSFQHSIRPASECKESTESNQFSFEENKRRQIVTSCDKCVLQQSHSEETRRKRLAFCSFGRGSACHLCQWTSCMKVCFNYSSGFFVVDKLRNMI